jgi:hypothetical protein
MIKRAKQVCTGWLVPVCEEVGVEKGHGRVNKMQIMCTRVCKWKNEASWNCSRNGGKEESRRMVEGVNSSMICLIYCKNFGKYHSAPPPNITIKKIDSLDMNHLYIQVLSHILLLPLVVIYYHFLEIFTTFGTSHEYHILPYAKLPFGYMWLAKK